MSSKVSFDIISDLYIEDADKFTWERKASSLYCIIAGNISSNTQTIAAVITKLSREYMGIFYIGGNLEFQNPYRARWRHVELARLCRDIPNVAYLYQHVVVIDGVAVVGAVGWNRDHDIGSLSEMITEKLRQQDYEYLSTTIERLQIHGDVNRIVVVTNTVPDSRLYFGKAVNTVEDVLPLSLILQVDTENKIRQWVYGQRDDACSVELDGITYTNNACRDRPNYTAYRITV